MTGTTTKAPMAMPRIVTENLMLPPCMTQAAVMTAAKPGLAGLFAPARDESANKAHQE
jgi:hypothetical protein